MLVLYSNFIGVKWEKEALVPRVGPSSKKDPIYGVSSEKGRLFVSRVRQRELMSSLASEVESPKYSLDEVKAITHPGFGGPGRERYSLAI